MSSSDLLTVCAVLAYTAFFAWVGYWLGVRFTTKRHLPALLAAVKKEPAAHLGNTVARNPQRPIDG